MWDFIFSSVWGWIGTAGIVVIASLVVGYFFPQFRIYALGVIGIVVSAATIYTKGSRDRAALENRRKEEAVRKANAAFDKIDARPDTPDSVAKRLRDGSF